MTTTAPTISRSDVRARRSGFFRDMLTVAKRALRAIPREPESILPAIILSLIHI